MKRLTDFSFDAQAARLQWREFQKKLMDNAILSERKDILPFFASRKQLALLCANYFPDIRNADRIAHEFVIHGDFIADMIVGDATLAKYVLVEFEDATPYSIFNKTPKSAPDWAKRFEGAFSQLIDWFWKLEDMRSTQAFSHVFGTREASFQGLIVCGKDLNLSSQEASRLQWRRDKVRVDSKAISSISFDDLCADMDFWLSRYDQV